MSHHRIAALLLGLAAHRASAGAAVVGVMTDPRLPEVSGFAASRAHPGLLWVDNDSGNPADVYLVQPGGKPLMTLHVDGVANVDWEDFASFDLSRNGRPHHYLLLADTGDNNAARPTVALHVIAEPARIADAHARPEWSITFRWPGGPRDCEAVAVDTATNSILLVSKRTVPARLYRLPLHPHGKGVLVAQPLGDLDGIPQPTRAELASGPFYTKYLAQVTAADIAPDRSSLAVLTYRSIYLYPRRANEDWSRAVARAPTPLSFGWLPQAEALVFRLDGRALYVSGEHLPAPIVQVKVPGTVPSQGHSSPPRTPPHAPLAK